MKVPADALEVVLEAVHESVDAILDGATESITTDDGLISREGYSGIIDAAIRTVIVHALCVWHAQGVENRLPWDRLRAAIVEGFRNTLDDAYNALDEHGENDNGPN